VTDLTPTPARAEAPAPLPPHAPLTDYYADEQARHQWVRRVFDDTAPDYNRIEWLMAFGSGPGTGGRRCSARASAGHARARCRHRHRADG
jgi:hypothetical protein